MDIYAISDLHLQGGADKPMNVFGPQWEGHFDRIRRDWRDKVSEDDVVLLPGDISWAMQTEDAMEDLRSIGELPGRKILLRGNHDYWWCGISRLRDLDAEFCEKGVIYARYSDDIILFAPEPEQVRRFGERGEVRPALRAVPAFPVHRNGSEGHILFGRETLAVLIYDFFYNACLPVHSAKAHAHTFQSRSSRKSRLTVFHTCRAASGRSARKPPVDPSRDS